MAVVEGRVSGASGVAQIQEIAAVLLADGSFALEVTPGQGTTGRTTAGGPAPGQVAKNYSGSVTLTGSAQSIPLETVTAGRTYFITDIVATTTSATALLFQITANAAQIFGSILTQNKGIEVPGIETQPSSSSGQAVAIAVPAGTGTVVFNVFGFEQ